MIDVSKQRHSNPLYYLKQFRVMYAANKNKCVSIKPCPAKYFPENDVCFCLLHIFKCASD